MMKPLICPEDKKPCTCATNPRYKGGGCPREKKRGNWIENTGKKPDVTCVHIKLNCDVEEWPGIPDIRYNESPDRWDWQRRIGGIEITHYMIPE